MSIKIIDVPNPQRFFVSGNFFMPWETKSKCCLAPTHFGLEGHTCDRCKKFCDIVTFGDIIELSNKRQKQEIAEYSKRKDREKMALQIIGVNERKMPRSKVGKYTGMEDIKQLFEELKKLPEGKAIQLTLDKATLDAFLKDGTKDPARSIVNMLKRKFENDGFSFKVYASDEKTVTVMRPIEKPKAKK